MTAIEVVMKILGNIMNNPSSGLFDDLYTLTLWQKNIGSYHATASPMCPLLRRYLEPENTLKMLASGRR